MLLDAAMIAQLRQTQESSMHHTCTIAPYIVGEDGTISYGTAGEPVICGFQLNSSALAYDSAYETVSASAKLRLPVGVTIGMKDLVTILTAFNETLDPQRTFMVTGLPASFGPSGQVIDLQEIFQ